MLHDVLAACWTMNPHPNISHFHLQEQPYSSLACSDQTLPEIVMELKITGET
jgi:hypothetical protein